jgi:GNAT superfamily N-acetyltransferase
MPTLAQLAEDTATYALPRPSFELVDRGDLVYEAGARRGTVQRIRLGDVETAVEWARAESRRRDHSVLEWWVGWSATPTDVADQLLALGLVPDDVPVLTGMTSETEPPPAAHVEVRLVTTIDEQLAALEVDWEVWQLDQTERAQRRAWERERFESILQCGAVHHFAAVLEDTIVGFGRAIDLEGGVGLFGGAVLPEARGQGVYRALVRARWEHAVTRSTPLLVVQAGDMSRPILAGLGFVGHGQIRLFKDRL